MAEERAQWGSSLEFILTVIGYAVGLGNVWRFPFLVFKYGGSTFLIPFFIMLFVVGIPIFFLETAVGQFTALSPSHAFAKMAPVFQGLGFSAITINAFIGFYYNVIIGYCVYYFLFSLRSSLPWKDCSNYESDIKKGCYVKFNSSINCDTDPKILEFNKENIKIRSPSEVYFYDDVLKLSDGIENLGGLVTPIVLSCLIAWFLVFVVLSKGVASLGKVSYFTATFPYVMMTVLVVRGALLENAGEGVKEYMLKFDTSYWAKPELWKDATVQIFYALSACSGGLISMSSFSAFNNNLLRDALLVPILDCLTGFYAGFAVFTVLGNMYLNKCVKSFSKVAAAGPELAFVVYPEGLSLMGTWAPLFSTLFFVMMLALGFGSEFSIMESVMSTFIDLFQNSKTLVVLVKTKSRVILVRLAIVIVYFLFGLTMATKGGLYVLNLVDTFIAGYPLLIVGLLQVIVVPWIYGTDRLCRDIETMIGPKPRWFWMIWIISWRFVTPIMLFAVIIATIIIKPDPVELNGVLYPDYAIALGWLIVAFTLSFIPICAIYQISKYLYLRKSLWGLLQPQPEYYNNYHKYLESKKKKQTENAEKPMQKNAEKLAEIEEKGGNSNKGFESFDMKNFTVSRQDDMNV